MKRNEYIIAAMYHAVLTIFTSFMSIFNLPAILTTYHLLSTGIECQSQDLHSSQLIFIDKILFLLSIVLTLVFSIIYFNILF